MKHFTVWQMNKTELFIISLFVGVGLVIFTTVFGLL